MGKAEYHLNLAPGKALVEVINPHLGTLKMVKMEGFSSSSFVQIHDPSFSPFRLDD